MKKITAVILFVLLVIAAAVPVAAQTNIPYTVSVIFPENQIDLAKEYFDLMMQPGQAQEITLILKNNTSAGINLEVAPQNGATSNTGNIDYTGAGTLLEETIPYRFTDICTTAQQIALGANETKMVSFVLTMPNEAFEGVVLGAFQIYEVAEETTVDTAGPKNARNGGSIEIQNRFAYIVGVVLRENNAVLIPSFNLGEVTTDLWNSRFALSAQVQMPVSTIVRNYELSGEVISRKTGNVVHSFRREQFSMAPNSVFYLYENLNHNNLPAGDYTIKLTIAGEDKEWIVESNFAISAIQKYHVMSQSIEGKSYVAISVLSCVMFILVVAVVTYSALLYQKRRGRRKLRRYCL